MVVKCQEMGYPSMKNQKHFRIHPMKFPDMNQYITLLFSLLVEFFSPTEPNPLARETGPRVRTRAPVTVVREHLIPNGTWRRKPLPGP